MSEVKRDYKVGYGKPPRGRPFQKGLSGNPRGPRRKALSSLLIAALNEPVYATIDEPSKCPDPNALSRTCDGLT